MSWWDYVQKYANGDSNADIARSVGVTPSSIGRWVNGGVDPNKAAAFARSYGRPVLEAFIAAGFLSPEEARATVVVRESRTIRDFSNEELLEVIRERLDVSEIAQSKNNYDLVADDAPDFEDEDELREMEP